MCDHLCLFECNSASVLFQTACKLNKVCHVYCCNRLEQFAHL